VPVQAIPVALVSSLYPFGLAALLLLLEAQRPKPRSLVFLIGAAFCTLGIGLAVVFIVRGAGVQQSSNSTPRYGLRLAIGVLFLVLAWVVAHRPPKQKEKKGDEQPSRVTRAVAGSGLLAVFFVGIAMYTPSPTYLSALDIVGSTKMSTAAAVGWTVLVVALVLITIEVPILVYLFASDWATRNLAAFNAWLSRNSRTLLIWVLIVLGVWEVIDGVVGLL
jgi:hypothetical protein